MINRKNKNKCMSQQNNTPDVENMTDEEFDGYINNVGYDQNNSEAAQPERDAQPFRTFATEEEYQNDVDKNLGNHFRKTSEELERYKKLQSLAMMMFNTNDESEAIYKLIQTAGAAMQNGVGSNSDTGVRQDAQKSNAMQLMESRNSSYMDDINRQIEELKKYYPDFNFDESMKNQDFRREFYNTGSVIMAFYKTGEQSDKNRRKRITENGMSARTAAGPVRKSPSDMSENEFKAYIDKISKKSAL